VAAAEATARIELELGRVEAELSERLERQVTRLKDQRRRLEENREEAERALDKAETRLTVRLSAVEQRAAGSATAENLQEGLDELGGRIAGQAVEAAQESAAVRGDLDRLRSRLSEVAVKLEGHEHRTADESAAVRGELEHLSASLDELGGRLDSHAGAAAQGSEELRSDFDQLKAQLYRLVGRMEDDNARLVDADAAVRTELDALRETFAEREADAEKRFRALLDGAAKRADDAMSLLAEKTVVNELGERLDGQGRELAGTRDALDSTASELRNAIGRLALDLDKTEEGLVDLRSNAAAELQHSTGALREEQASAAAELRAESEEREQVLRVWLSDQQTSLHGAKAEIVALRDGTAERERLREQGDAALSARIDGLDSRVVEEAAHAAEATEATGRALREGLGLVADRIEQVEHRSLEADEGFGTAISELERALGEVAMRSAERGAESERALRAELVGAKEAHEALKSDVERISSFHGWRLARAEETLQALGVEELRQHVTELDRRLDVQAHQAQVQAKAAEQAVREGLAGIAKKLLERERTFVEAGQALSSSLEELESTIQSADRQVAGRESKDLLAERFAQSTTFVAFAPLEDGYRLVECKGAPPAAGAMLEVPGIEGVLVVERVADSPLPFDGRPCAYLERAV